ncbi:hypothetical protein [Marinospirillum celere]|uniref:hypothetical protein n=1 Tax=Marinospirillum celere TaxID=1122252 RepID=UPI000B855E54|nr:hypothetical protein [Marinospirillum celere]
MDGKLTTTWSWLLGCSLILSGFWLSGFYFLTGVSLALIGFLWWPPSRQFLIKRLKLPPVFLLHVALTVCLLVIALFAFIGRYTVILEERALEQGYPSLEAWQDAQRQQNN